MVFILCIILGLFFIASGIYLFVDEASFRKSAIETEGIITRIEAYRSRGETRYRVFVAYTVGSERYESRLGDMSAEMKEGQPIRIYYSPSNPNRITHAGSIFLLLKVPLFGVPFFLVGFISLYKQRKRRKLKEALLTNGHRVMADISEITNDIATIGTITFKGSYYVICKWTDKAGKDHFFKSNRIWEYPRLEGITTIIVYLDPNDYSKYYVDMDMSQGAFFSSTTGSAQNTVPDSKDRSNIDPFIAIIVSYGNWAVYIIVEFLMLAGIVIVYRQLTSPTIEILLLLIGSFFAGVGIFSNAHLLYSILSPQKAMPALLVSIEKTGMLIGTKQKYSLKFQNERGKYYSFITNDILNLQENNTYILTVKANKVLNVGQQHFQQIYPRKV